MGLLFGTVYFVFESIHEIVPETVPEIVPKVVPKIDCEIDPVIGHDKMAWTRKLNKRKEIKIPGLIEFDFSFHPEILVLMCNFYSIY